MMMMITKVIPITSIINQNDKTNGDNDNYDDLTPPNDGTIMEDMEEVEDVDQLKADQTNDSSNYPNFHM